MLNLLDAHEGLSGIESQQLVNIAIPIATEDVIVTLCSVQVFGHPSQLRLPGQMSLDG